MILDISPRELELLIEACDEIVTCEAWDLDKVDEVAVILEKLKAL